MNQQEESAALLAQVVRLFKDTSEPPSVRMDAIRYIVGHFDASCVDVFEEIIDNVDEPVEVRSAAMLGIAKTGHARALDIVIQHAVSADATLRNYAIQALGMLGHKEAIPILIDALASDDNTIFESAAESLGRIGSAAAPELIRLLEGDGPDDARCVAAWKLGELQYSPATDVLLAVIRQNANTELMALCIWALGEIGERTTEVTDTLHWAQSHEHDDVKRRAELAIRKITRHIN